MSATPSYGIGRLGEYAVIRSLGEGTFGKVKLARHTLSGQHVALKFIHKGRINRMKVRTRIVREIEYLKQLTHPHIIKLYEVINTPTEVIMVMEYAGGELFNYIVENGRLPEVESRRFFQQMLYGLAYSHSHNIVHRDIKPENVLLDDANNVKLADFGLSNTTRDGSWLSTSCGSPNYAAPEVISGSLYAGPEIDVWSLGVILYVMLCGRLPFEDEHVPALFQKIASGRYHVPKYLSEDARFLIAGMLVVDPMKRLSIQDLLEHRWTNVDLPDYLKVTQDQLNPGRRPDTLTSILGATAATNGPDWIEDLGLLDYAVLEELATSLNVPPSVVRTSLELEGENAVKVAYKLIQDRTVLKDPDAAVNREPAPGMSSSAPIWIPQSGPRHGAQDVASGSDDLFTEGEEYTEDEDDEGMTSPGIASVHNFNWLDTSLNEAGGGTAVPSPVFQPANHHLANYGNSRSAASVSRQSGLNPSARPAGTNDSPARSHRSGGASSRRDRDHYPRQPRWHFGIRSSSPPMEVITELYRTLEALGIQWRQKRGIWAATRAESDAAIRAAQEAGYVNSSGEPDGAGDSFEGEAKEDTDIYYIECRWRLRNTVLLMDLQLYQVDAMNYLVDFRDLGYYQPSNAPNAGKFEPAEGEDDGHGTRIRRKKEGDYPQPLLFLECACRLILELAGGSG